MKRFLYIAFTTLAAGGVLYAAGCTLIWVLIILSI